MWRFAGLIGYGPWYEHDLNNLFTAVSTKVLYIKNLEKN